MGHAQQIGEWITTPGAYPSLAIGPLLDSHKHDIAAMLRESLETERQALDLYRELLGLVEGRFVALEEPGELAAFSAPSSSRGAKLRRVSPR